MLVTILLLSLFTSVTSSAHVWSIPTNQKLSPSETSKIWKTKLSFGPSPEPSLSSKHHAFVGSHGKDMSKPHPRHHKRKPHAVPPKSFNPSHGQGCGHITCSYPFTSTPINSPCGCVFPMKVELYLGVAPYTIFPRVSELETEIALGTYLKQSQVRIMGANADNEDQGRTIVKIDLVPLGEKFEKKIASLIYERLYQNKVPINMNLFGKYEVINVEYPGLPSSPQSRYDGGNGTSGSSPTSRSPNPFVANVTDKDQKMNARIVAVIVLSTSVVIVMCIGAVVILLNGKKPKRPSAVGPSITSFNAKRFEGIEATLSNTIASSIPASLTSTMDACRLLVKTFSLAELEKATEKFNSKNLLGKGGFGRVYHGTMEDGSEVAVKLLTRWDPNGDRDFIAEVEMLSRLHHCNLIKLIGVCIERETRCLIYEVVRNGSVESHLHGVDRRRGPLDWDARMKIALGAARGLAYLHEDSNPRVIHRDFKASNILLENDFTPKVSDFGLAREASEGSQHISTRVMGTFGYVAPEYAMTGHLLVKSDVYSYGVVLLELLSGRRPIDMSRPQGQENLVTWARPLLTNREGLQQLLDPALGKNYNFDKVAKVAAIASMCVQPEVSQRPFMGEVVQALKLVYNDRDETSEDSCSQREDADLKDDVSLDICWWDGDTPCLAHRHASSLMTMDCSSSPIEERHRPASTSYLTRHNRSGPLQTIHDNLAFYRSKGSMSDHGLLVRCASVNRYMV